MNASAAPAWLVGIDLGTTNTVLAYAAPGSRQVDTFAIEQLVAPGEVAPSLLLPSARYHPAAGELPPGALQLPWQARTWPACRMPWSAALPACSAPTPQVG